MSNLEPIRALVGACWAWGAVMAHRESGGYGYPSFAQFHGQRYRPVGGMSLCNLGAAFADIERSIRHHPPLVRGLLYFQYGRPHIEENARRSVHDYVDFVFGDGISLGEREKVARTVRKIRRQWASQAALELFGPVERPKENQR